MVHLRVRFAFRDHTSYKFSFWVTHSGRIYIVSGQAAKTSKGALSIHLFSDLLQSAHSPLQVRYERHFLCDLICDWRHKLSFQCDYNAIIICL